MKVLLAGWDAVIADASSGAVNHRPGFVCEMSIKNANTDALLIGSVTGRRFLSI